VDGTARGPFVARRSRAPKTRRARQRFSLLEPPACQLLPIVCQLQRTLGSFAARLRASRARCAASYHRGAREIIPELIRITSSDGLACQITIGGTCDANPRWLVAV